jgi:ribosome maturation factor RimP
MMNEIAVKIKEFILPILDREGIHLVDLELRGYANNQVLSIFVDTDTGITLEQVANITREIEGILDLEDPIHGRYRLEVSSPGIDRPLTELWQFRKNIGRWLRVLYNDQNQKLEKTGLLKEIKEDRILLAEKKQELEIPLSQIIKAVIKINL